MKATDKVQPQENDIDPYDSLLQAVDYRREYHVPEFIHKEIFKDESVSE